MKPWPRLLLSFTLAVVWSISVSAQTLLSGVVMDASKNPIEGASIQLSIGQKKTVAISITDERGQFSLSTKGQADSLYIIVSHISFEKKSIRLGAEAKDITIVLSPQQTILKEVTVKTPSLTQRGDTLTYSLRAFSGEGDYRLRDALKKLPGIDVAESGKIKYQGKEISNFYIEGLDLLGGKYNIATNNIPSSYVSSVQVLSNHSDAKIDKDVLTDDVALNISLTKKAKIKPVGSYSLVAGIGESALYQASGSGMIFKPQVQVIGVLKAGNIQEFANDNTTDNIAGEKASTLASMIVGDISGATPPIKRERYIFPGDYLTSLSTIGKLSENATLRANVGYGFSRTRYEYGYNLDFVDSSRPNITIQQQTTPTERRHTPFLEIEYKNNGDRRYVQNKFSVKASYLSSDIAETSPSVLGNSGLKGRYRDISFSDALSLRWRKGNTQWGVSSLVGYSTAPTAQIMLLSNGLEQLAASEQFLSKISLFSSYEVKRSRISFPISIQYKRDELSTQSIHSTIVSNAINNLKGDNLLLSFIPEYEYTHPLQKYVFRARLDLSSDYINYRNMGTWQAQHRKTYFRFNPSIYLSYKLNAQSDLRVQGAYTEGAGALTDLLTSAVQDNIISASIGSGILAQNKTLHLSTDYRFRLPIEMWFFNTGVTYTYQHRNLISSQTISSGLVNTSYIPQDNGISSLNIFASLTKQIQSLHTKLSLTSIYNHSNQSMMQNGVIYEYEGGSFSLMPSVVSKPLKFIEINYTYTLNKGFSRIKNTTQSLRAHTHDIRIDLKPMPKWSFKLAAEMNSKEISPGHWAKLCMFDIGLTHSNKSLRYTLELNNILNEQSYNYSVFSGINTYSYSYSLRGRELLLSITLTI